MEQPKQGPNRGNAGKGRPKGSPNKINATLKEAILAAGAEHGYDGAGTGGLQGYLLKVASEDVKAFSGLLGRVLPMTVEGTGDGGAIVFQTIYETKP
jgi:hypothetical protein